MLRTGLRVKRPRITWDKQVLTNSTKKDETPSTLTGVLAKPSTFSGALVTPAVLRPKRRLGDSSKAIA
jgi:hypothetical protein